MNAMNQNTSPKDSFNEIISKLIKLKDYCSSFLSTHVSPNQFLLLNLQLQSGDFQSWEAVGSPGVTVSGGQ